MMTLSAYDSEFPTVTADARWQLVNGYLPIEFGLQPGEVVAMTDELVAHLTGHCQSVQNAETIAMMEATDFRFVLESEIEFRPPAETKRGYTREAINTFTLAGVSTLKPIYPGVLQRARIHYCLSQYTHQTRELGVEPVLSKINGDREETGRSFVAVFKVICPLQPKKNHVRCILFFNAVNESVDEFIERHSNPNDQWELIRIDRTLRGLLVTSYN